VNLQILEWYGSGGVLVAALLAVVRLLIYRGFHLSFKAEVPRRPARPDDF
jgi:hypothetical protein